MDTQDDDIAIATADESEEPEESGNPVKHAGLEKDSGDDEVQFEEPMASPAVTDESGFAGDASSAEPMDIDEAMNQAGIEKPPHDRDND